MKRKNTWCSSMLSISRDWRKCLRESFPSYVTEASHAGAFVAVHYVGARTTRGSGQKGRAEASHSTHRRAVVLCCRGSAWCPGRLCGFRGIGGLQTCAHTEEWDAGVQTGLCAPSKNCTRRLIMNVFRSKKKKMVESVWPRNCAALMTVPPFTEVPMRAAGCQAFIKAFSFN